LIKELRKQRYDYVIDLHDNFRSRRIAKSLRAKVLTFKKERIQKFLLTKFHINQMSGRHIVDRCVDTLAPLGVQNDGKGMDYFIPAGKEVPVEAMPLSHMAGFVVMVIGASYATKKMPVSKLQDLCSRIDFPIILVGGKEDQEEGEAIATIDPVRIYNACGKFSLHESADLVQKARLVISHDTGLQYIACAFDKPVLAIWGATSPALDVEPYYRIGSKARHQNLIVPGLKCQPCSNYGTKSCPKKHFNCMQQQDTVAIAELANQWLLG